MEGVDTVGSTERLEVASRVVVPLETAEGGVLEGDQLAEGVVGVLGVGSERGGALEGDQVACRVIGIPEGDFARYAVPLQGAGDQAMSGVVDERLDAGGVDETDASSHRVEALMDWGFAAAWVGGDGEETVEVIVLEGGDEPVGVGVTEQAVDAVPNERFGLAGGKGSAGAPSAVVGFEPGGLSVGIGEGGEGAEFIEGVAGDLAEGVGDGVQAVLGVVGEPGLGSGGVGELGEASEGS